MLQALSWTYLAPLYEGKVATEVTPTLQVIRNKQLPRLVDKLHFQEALLLGLFECHYLQSMNMRISLPR
jgi:hypothetical protein